MYMDDSCSDRFSQDATQSNMTRAKQSSPTVQVTNDTRRLPRLRSRRPRGSLFLEGFCATNPALSTDDPNILDDEWWCLGTARKGPCRSGALSCRRSTSGIHSQSRAPQQDITFPLTALINTCRGRTTMEKHSTGSGMGQHPKLLTRKAPQKNQRFQHYESRKQMSHAKRRSKEIDRSLKEDARKRRSQCVVSIDGIHNSGPRFARQLQILISHGLPHEQRLSHKNNIQKCLCHALRSAATATRDETKSPITTTTKRTAEQILTQLPNPDELEPGWRPSPDTVASALLLWSDEGLRETLKSKREPWIPGKDNYDRYAKPCSPHQLT